MINLHLPSKQSFIISGIAMGVVVLGALPSYYFYDKYQNGYF